MSLSCNQFQDMLIDLVYNEATAETSAALQQHAQNCIDCRANFESFLLTKKMIACSSEKIQPPESINNPILKMAEEAAAAFLLSKNSNRTSPKTNSHTERNITSFKKGSKFFEKFQGWLLRPALITTAVASVALVIAIFIDKNAANPDNYSDTQYTVVPSIDPAIHLEEKKKEQVTPVQTVESVTDDQKSPVHETSAPKKMPAVAKKSRTKKHHNAAGKARKNKKRPARSRSTPQNTFKSSKRAQKIEPSPMNNEQDSIDVLGALDVQGELATEVETPDETAYQRGVNAFNEGDCTTAKEFLQKVAYQPSTTTKQASKSLHLLSKCARRAGQCSKAVLHLDRLLKNYPHYAKRSEAMWEAANCHKRLGHQGKAKKLLHHLAKDPHWSNKATKELDQIELLENK